MRLLADDLIMRECEFGSVIVKQEPSSSILEIATVCDRIELIYNLSSKYLRPFTLVNTQPLYGLLATKFEHRSSNTFRVLAVYVFLKMAPPPSWILVFPIFDPVECSSVLGLHTCKF